MNKNSKSLGSLCAALLTLTIPIQSEAYAVLKTPQAAAWIPATASAILPVAVKAGSLEITAPWLRATPNGAKVAGGYLTVSNTGSEPDRLIGAAIPLASRGEVHEMSLDNGMMRMRQLADGLDIKPGQTIELKPGSYHLMFVDLKEPLKQGDTIEGTLTFAKAGEVNITFKVGGIADMAPPDAAAEPMHMH